jgi:hypothetical protein
VATSAVLRLLQGTLFLNFLDCGPSRSDNICACSLLIALIAIVVLGKSRTETCDNGDLLRLWLLGYALRCCLLARVLYTRHRLYQRGAAARAGGAPNMYRERARTEHTKARLDALGTVSFVLGSLWLFGSVDCPSAAPLLTKLTLSYLLIGFVSLFVPLLFFAALVTLLPCVLAFLNTYADALGLRPSDGDAGVDARHSWMEELPQHAFVPSATSCDGDGDDTEAAAGPSSQGDIETCTPAPPQSQPADDDGHMEDSASVAASDASSSQESPHGGWLGKRHVAAEDACCCVCLGRYTADSAVTELPPCDHHFHTACIRTWLRVNASCPLCKARVGPAAQQEDPNGEEDEATAREAYLAAAVRGGDDLFSIIV